MFTVTLARLRLNRAVAGMPDRLRRDVGFAPDGPRRRYLPDLPTTDGGEAPLRRLIGVCLLRR